MAQVTNSFNFHGMNADDMHKSYKRLVKKYHPDVAGYDSTEDMKRLNGEFAYQYALASRDSVYNFKVENNPSKKGYYDSVYQSATYVETLARKIEWLITHRIYTLGNLRVELAGVFIWISGERIRDDKELREEIKAAGFAWQGDKKAWYWTCNPKLRVRTDTTLSDVRYKYSARNIYGPSLNS